MCMILTLSNLPASDGRLTPSLVTKRPLRGSIRVANTAFNTGLSTSTGMFFCLDHDQFCPKFLVCFITLKQPQRLEFMSSNSLNSIYRALDEICSDIRLLEVIPGSIDAAIECKLSVVSLTDKTAFTALSYVWGNPKVTEDIKVNGKVLSVIANLAVAL